jgi:UDP-N-acetylglucosamine diphosphorylase / glucose-1-phosphate thymidylyltransferase / UDP-N-acetylgalactosamine diphosphorylase / glucosamine-1-phosphate N-acetyltransferase / galactosamine-1-phosphate N-acetyltransferase
MKGVLLAAGEGKRMRPLTFRRPKPLVPVVDRPMIEHIITGAAQAGVDDWLIVIGHLKEKMVACLGDGSRLGVRISYQVQEAPTGTGAAALLAEEFVAGQSFFLSWGDIMVPARNYAHVVEAWREEQPYMVLSVNRIDDPWAGAAVYVENDRVTRIIEKPPRGTSTTNYNNAGVFVYPAGIFDYLRRVQPSARGERELPDAIQMLLHEGKRVRAVEMEGYWSDVASPQAAIELSGAMIYDREPSGLLIHPTATVSPEARLTAPVAIGPHCRVGVAQIGPNVCLLEGAQVEDGAVLTNCMVYAGAEVGGAARLEYAIAEEGTRVCGPLIGEPEAVAVEA